MVADFPDGDRRDGSRIDGLGLSRSRWGFRAVGDVWRHGTKFIHDEEASFMDVVVRRPSSMGVVTGASMLQEGDSARSTFPIQSLSVAGTVSLC